MPRDRTPGLVVALAGSTHPGPAVAVTVIAVVLGVGVGLEPWRLILLGLAVAANQASVGLCNDWIDAERDRAVGRRDKPIARGWIDVRTVRIAAIVSFVIAVALTVPLGIGTTVVHTVFIASAWSYNLGLKSTVISVLPYIVSFGLLPAIVTLARQDSAPPAGWALAVGALLGVAAHLANVLPDLDDDRATGVRGLPHRLGLRTTGLATWLVLEVASVIAFVGAGEPGPVPWVGLALTTAIAVAGTVLVLTRPPSRALFQLIIAAALIIVAELALAGDRLLV